MTQCPAGPAGSAQQPIGHSQRRNLRYRRRGARCVPVGLRSAKGRVHSDRRSNRPDHRQRTPGYVLVGRCKAGTQAALGVSPVRASFLSRSQTGEEDCGPDTSELVPEGDCGLPARCRPKGFAVPQRWGKFGWSSTRCGWCYFQGFGTWPAYQSMISSPTMCTTPSWPLI